MNKHSATSFCHVSPTKGSVSQKRSKAATRSQASHRNVNKFHPELLDGAILSPHWEIPTIHATEVIPNNLIPFSTAMRKDCTDFDAFVCFYEDDSQFERFWNHPEKYLPQLRKFAGVISPDFSIYPDAPFYVNVTQIARNYALGSWLQRQGITVIANIRVAGERTLSAALDAAPHNSVIAVGAHGTLKRKDNRDQFFTELSIIISVLHPTMVLLYGTNCYGVFDLFEATSIPLKFYEPEITKIHRSSTEQEDSDEA